MRTRTATSESPEKAEPETVASLLATHDISVDMVAHYTKSLFIDVATMKMTVDARRVCERLGLKPEDLLEKSDATIR